MPTLLRVGPKRGSMKLPKPVYYIGGRLNKKKELGTVYHGPFVNEITALEVVGEKGWNIFQITKKGKFKMLWSWETTKWIKTI